MAGIVDTIETRFQRSDRRGETFLHAYLHESACRGLQGDKLLQLGKVAARRFFDKEGLATLHYFRGKTEMGSRRGRKEDGRDIGVG